MAGMLTYLNLGLIGTHHSGIDDSRNISRIALELIQRGGLDCFNLNMIKN
jgi:hypothetical protein